MSKLEVRRRYHRKLYQKRMSPELFKAIECESRVYCFNDKQFVPGCHRLIAQKLNCTPWVVYQAIYDQTRAKYRQLNS